ncbi:MAG: DUF2851 domain-containing protein [Marinilabiliales bacterium]|nr:MAG: DUF2851 domain-containing protein [Marinilabiliales bacterium]
MLKKMKEEFLYYLWSNKLLSPMLKTTNNQDITIINQGRQNHDSGPDFFNARIKINGQIWAGNVEIHVKSSDWEKHGHNHDDNYDNIILHVVFVNDMIIKRKSGEIIPCLEISGHFDEKMINIYENFMASKTWIACANSISNVNHFEIHSWLDKLGVERLEIKSNNFIKQLEETKNDFQQLFYQKLSRAFGFNTNSQAFEMMASILPFSTLKKCLNNQLQIEALLFGQAGFLNNEFHDEYPNQLKREFNFLANKYSIVPMDIKLWKHMRMRPVNFPSIRISQFAALLEKSGYDLLNIIETDRLKTVISLFECSASEYWDTHFRFDNKVKKSIRKKLGITSVNLILINTIIPFLFTYGRLNNKPTMEEKAINWLEQIKAENNLIIRNFKKLDISPKTAFHSQALIHLHKNYCDSKRCLNCRIGHNIISGKVI